MTTPPLGDSTARQVAALEATRHELLVRIQAAQPRHAAPRSLALTELEPAAPLTGAPQPESIESLFAVLRTPQPAVGYHDGRPAGPITRTLRQINPPYQLIGLGLTLARRWINGNPTAAMALATVQEGAHSLTPAIRRSPFKALAVAAAGGAVLAWALPRRALWSGALMLLPQRAAGLLGRNASPLAAQAAHAAPATAPAVGLFTTLASLFFAQQRASARG